MNRYLDGKGSNETCILASKDEVVVVVNDLRSVIIYLRNPNE